MLAAFCASGGGYANGLNSAVFGKQCRAHNGYATGVAVRRRASRPSSSALRMEVDSNTIIAIGAALLGVGGGIGLVAWTENQGMRTEQRENLQPCVDCRGAKSVPCNICKGTGQDPVFKSQKEPCAYCEGAGTTMCDNCTGTGIQPRFLDRLSPDDFMD